MAASLPKWVRNPVNDCLSNYDILVILNTDELHDEHKTWMTAKSSRFQLLKRACIEARYSEHYEITAEQLDWLIERVEVLQGLVKTLCREKIEGFVQDG